MASSSVFFTLVIFISMFLFYSASGTLVFPLTHSFSRTQFNSTHHLLKSTTVRSASRLHHHRHPHRQVSLPLAPGSDYTLSFSLGSQTISLYMDTGSDVVWLPCHPFDCILCEGKYNPTSIPNPGPINLTSAVPVSCKSRACSAVHSSLPSSDLCTIAKCPLEDIEISDCKSYSCPPFYYAYGDGSFIAKLYSDELSIPMSSPSLILKNFTFGCAHSALGEPIGVAGFGRGTLSLPAQLANNSPEIGNYFSYCLVSHTFDTNQVHRPSPLILGRYSIDEKMKQMKNYYSDYAYTPMLENPKHPYFYSVGLEGVSIGKTKIPAPASLRRVDRRIWHLTRKKKQIAWDDAQKLVKRRVELEKGRFDAAEDLSELSEGEKEKGDVNTSESHHVISRINSDTQIWSDEDKPSQLYIVLISMHGLVRGENMELGRDSDTGGQVKYVVELARALANMKGVHRVDLLTRQITSPDVDSSYGEPIEMLSCPSDAFGCCGAYIIRIPCGPRDKYIPKESLWPYIPEFVDGALSHIVNMSRAIGEQVNAGKAVWPYVIHGHYADAGEVAARLSGTLNVPMVLTGHSLGRNKFEQLLKQGRLTKGEINNTYKIMRRIEAEELGLDTAEMVITSTRQEIDEQWGLYDGFDIQLERKLRVRRRRGVSCLGRYMPRMVVIPPGMDFSNINAQDSLEGDGDLKSLIGAAKSQKRPIPHIWSEIMRFFVNPHKPMILALSRPDPKKNVTTLLRAFGECQALRELANLTLILGNRDDIDDMSSSSSAVLTTVIKLIDKYNLYGQVAYPKHHKQPEVPDIYRLAAKTKGVFINPALVEPFGLTLIEAAAYGLPIVATKNGGPVDIVKALHNGLLIDPHDQKAIEDALLKLVADKNLWLECRKNGLKNIHCFSWPEHCRNYLSHVQHCRNRHPANCLEVMKPAPEEPMSESLRDVEDLSLKFSIDVDFKANGEMDMARRQHELVEILSRKANSINKPIVSYSPGRRKVLYVVATDCYNSNGSPTETLSLTVKNIMQVARSRSSQIGLLFLTGLCLQETKEVVNSCPTNLEDFDALICSSGSEIYYPWKDLGLDDDYEAHIEYRWPGENIKSAVMRLGKIEEGSEHDIAQCPSASSFQCYSYSIKPGAEVRKVNDLRQRLRMRGFRCNVVYTHAASRLNVTPLFASRSQALRYLSVRWGVDLSSMVVFVGEKGDTDYESLLVGLHKTVILKRSVEYASEKLLHNEDSFKTDEIVPLESTNICAAEGYEPQDITAALEKLGVM